MNIHHLGCLVSNIEKAIEQYHFLGFLIETQPKYDPERKVDIVFMVKDGIRVELICPKDEHSPFYDLLKKKDCGPYHICYETDEFEKLKKNLLLKKPDGGGFIQITPSVPAPAIDGCDVTFFYHKEVGIIEVIDRNKS